MKTNWQYKLGTKAVATLLFLALATATTFCAAGVLVLGNTGHFSDRTDRQAWLDSAQQTMADYNSQALTWYRLTNSKTPLTRTQQYQLDKVLTPALSTKSTNYAFAVYAQQPFDETGRPISPEALDAYDSDIHWEQTLDAEPVYTSVPMEQLLSDYAPSTDYLDEGDIALSGYVRKTPTVHDAFFAAKQTFAQLDACEEPALAGLAGFGVLTLALLVFLLVLAGRRQGTVEAVARAADRWWLEPVTVVAWGGVLLGGVGLAALVEVVLYGRYPGSASILWWILGFCSLACLTCALGLWWLMTVTVRLKTHTLGQSCLLWRLCRRCWSGLRRLGGAVGDSVRQANVLWPGLLLPFVAGGFLLLLTALFWAPGLVIAGLVLYAAWCILLLELSALQKGAKRIAAGDILAAVDCKRLHGPLRAHGEALNHIRDGISAAVRTQLKAERMKTELLTNVSHDIKTPLTSIVSYVDLLKQEELPTERARGYVEVLDRQSVRLKKLLEDLIEASKATSGNVAVQLETVHLGELLVQSVGEYSERLAAAELTPILALPEDSDVTVSADGRLLWRVLDNLLSNAAKYALAGTRVYFNLTVGETAVELSVKNTSREQLNVSADELMERFVRGDASRTGAGGSGLGLSIARSLTELMGGKFDLIVDGDLFKATLTFPPEN
ncbi:MAG: HAMP domain-containing sensor histidine kinase [Oscillospiraceae bacterium]